MIEKWKSIFIKIYTGQAISIVTSGIVQFVLILYITKTTGSAFYLAMASMAGFLPQGILSIFVGAFIDRNNRKRIIVYADLFIALATLLLVIFISLNLLSINLILIFLVVRSIGSAFHAPALQATIPLIVPVENLLKYNGYIMAIQSLSLVISPIIGALLFELLSLNIILSLDIIGACFASLMVIVVKIPEVVKNDSIPNNYWFDLKKGFEIINTNKKIKLLFIYIFFFTLLFMPINALFPLMVTSYFNLGSIYLGIVETAFALGMLISSIMIGKLVFFNNLDRNIVLACLLMSFSLILSGILSLSMYLIFILLCIIMGLCGPLFNSSFSTIIAQNVAEEYLGRIYSSVFTITLLATPIGLLFTGMFADNIGVNIWFLLTGILMLLLVVFQYY
ncbi:MFS transporter, partial [Erysipelotrichaceae bacterium OttesenSCG-928-M19]|nr:MFS transporter [Erysipelotrichaceae bacterium OttesenSCG-928-M19]